MPYRRVKARLAQTDTWLLELFLGLYTLIWGLNLANPLTDAFAASPRTYALLSTFPGGEPVLGALASACGALVLASAAGGARRTRARATGAVGVWWLLVSIAVAIPTGFAGGGVLLLVALAHWYCWTRLSYGGPEEARP